MCLYFLGTSLTTACVQFMNNDYVGEQKGRCSNFGFDKNELKFSAYIKQESPFAPPVSEDPVVALA